MWRVIECEKLKAFILSTITHHTDGRSRCHAATEFICLCTISASSSCYFRVCARDISPLHTTNSHSDGDAIDTHNFLSLFSRSHPLPIKLLFFFVRARVASSRELIQNRKKNSTPYISEVRHIYFSHKSSLEMIGSHFALAHCRMSHGRRGYWEIFSSIRHFTFHFHWRFSRECTFLGNHNKIPRTVWRKIRIKCVRDCAIVTENEKTQWSYHKNIK